MWQILAKSLPCRTDLPAVLTENPCEDFAARALVLESSATLRIHHAPTIVNDQVEAGVKFALHKSEPSLAKRVPEAALPEIIAISACSLDAQCRDDR